MLHPEPHSSSSRAPIKERSEDLDSSSITASNQKKGEALEKEELLLLSESQSKKEVELWRKKSEALEEEEWGSGGRRLRL